MRAARGANVLAGVAVVLAAFSLLVTAALFQQNRQFGETNRDHFCQVERERMAALEQRRTQTFAYFNSPAGREPSAFNDFIRQVTLPALTTDVAKARSTWPVLCGELPTATSR